MNLVILHGRLVADPEHGVSKSGVSYVGFRVAVNRPFTGADGKREADFIDCVAWRTTADFIAKHFKKGQGIALSGRLEIRSYEAQDGSKRSQTRVVADRVEFAEEGRAKKDGFTESDDELPF